MIPTVDLAPLHGDSAREKREVANATDAACTEIGFFLVTGHGVSAELIQSTRQRAIEFFALARGGENEGAAAAGKDQPRL